jgi:hypothetical protein
MEIFLWLLLLFRALCILAPYIVGTAGGLILAGYISQRVPLPFAEAAALFVTFAIAIGYGVKNVLSGNKQDG